MIRVGIDVQIVRKTTVVFKKQIFILRIAA